MNTPLRLFVPKDNGPKAPQGFDLLDAALRRSGHVAVSAPELARKLARLDRWAVLIDAVVLKKYIRRRCLGRARAQTLFCRGFRRRLWRGSC